MYGEKVKKWASGHNYFSSPIALMNELGAEQKDILTSICIIPGFLPYTQW